MARAYSVLILPQSETRIRRFVFSRRFILCFLLAGAILLAVSGWLLSDYLRTKRQLWGLKQAGLNTENYREQLSALQEQSRKVQSRLAEWGELQSRIRASLPTKHRSSANGRFELDELEKSLASLRSELERLIVSVPTRWPAQGPVSSGLGMRPNPWTGKPEFHAGLDIPKTVGTAVYAPGDGVVERAGSTNGNGKMVILNHGEGITTLYAHLSTIHVKEGEPVSKGQVIANVGNTGKSTSPHLHYEVRVNGVPIDPRRNLIQENPPSS